VNSTMLDRTLAETAGLTVPTRSGGDLTLRPVRPDDGALVADLFDRLGPDGLRFRFLTGMQHPRPSQVASLIEVDHRHKEHLLAFAGDPRSAVASLLIAADPEMEGGEVAIAVAEDWRGKGLGHALLKHATDLARERGLTTIRSVESRACHDAIEVERTLGFTARSYDGDATLVVLEMKLD